MPNLITNENGEVIQYRNFPTNYSGMLPLSDAEARRMGCTIYRELRVPFDKDQPHQSIVKYAYPQPPRKEATRATLSKLR